MCFPSRFTQSHPNGCDCVNRCGNTERAVVYLFIIYFIYYSWSERGLKGAFRPRGLGAVPLCCGTAITGADQGIRDYVKGPNLSDSGRGLKGPFRPVGHSAALKHRFSGAWGSAATTAGRTAAGSTNKEGKAWSSARPERYRSLGAVPPRPWRGGTAPGIW